MNLALGVALILISLVLVVLAWPGGSRLGELSMARSMMIAYGVLCLTLTVLGLVLIAKA